MTNVSNNVYASRKKGKEKREEKEEGKRRERKGRQGNSKQFQN